MNFWHFMVYALFIGLVFLAVRLALFLGRFLERLMATMVKIGFPRAAKGILWLIDYDQDTYRKSRLIYWNRVDIRFSLLWGGLIFLAGFLAILKEGRTISAIMPLWLLALGIYLAYRWYALTITPAEVAEEEDVIKLMDKLNSNPMQKNSKGEDIMAGQLVFAPMIIWTSFLIIKNIFCLICYTICIMYFICILIM